MRIIRNAYVAVSSMGSQKFQSFLSLIGTKIGTMCFVCAIAIGLGSREAVQDQLELLGENVIIIIAGQSSNRGRVNSGEENFKVSDVNAIRKINGVKFASEGIRGKFVVKKEGIVSNPKVDGVSFEFQNIRRWILSAGRFINDYDIKTYNAVCVVGQTVKNDLFPYENPIGQKISIEDEHFLVIGVLEPKGFSSRGQDYDDVIYVPFSTAQKRLVSQDYIHFSLVSAANKEAIDSVIREIKLILRRRHRLQSYQDDDFSIMNQAEFAKTGIAISMTLTTMLGAMAISTLITGGVSIMLNMITSVKARTREIGLRMALGARQCDISAQFIVEGLVLSSVGAFGGLLLGIFVSMLLGSMIGWATLLSLPLLTIAFFISVLNGIFFSYWPARKASRLSPIDALKSE